MGGATGAWKALDEFTLKQNRSGSEGEEDDELLKHDWDAICMQEVRMTPADWRAFARVAKWMGYKGYHQEGRATRKRF